MQPTAPPSQLGPISAFGAPPRSCSDGASHPITPFYRLSDHHILFKKRGVMKMDMLRTKRQFSAGSLVFPALVLGIALGVAVSFGMNEEALARIGDMSDKLMGLESDNWLNACLSSFFGAEVFVIALFLCGFGAVFQPVSIAVCALRGIGLGICVTGAYLSDSPLVSISVFLPFAILSTAVILVQAKQSLHLSGCYLALSTTTENRLGIKNEAAEYTARFIYLSLILAIICALDCLIIRLI